MSKRLQWSAGGAIGLTGLTLLAGAVGALSGKSEAGVPTDASDVRVEPASAKAALTVDPSTMIEVPHASFSVSSDAELVARVESLLQANRAVADAAVQRVAPLTEVQTLAELAQKAFSEQAGVTLAASEAFAPIESIAPVEIAALVDADFAIEQINLATLEPPSEDDRIVFASLSIETPGGVSPIEL